MGAPGDGLAFPPSNALVLLVTHFTASELTRIRHKVAQRATTIGLRGDRLDDFVSAVYEILTNAVRHGGGTGSLRMARTRGYLVCQVDDDGPGFPPETPCDQSLLRPGGRGLGLARQFADRLTITDRAPGTSVRVYMAIS